MVLPIGPHELDAVRRGRVDAHGRVPGWFDDDSRVLRADDATGRMGYEHHRVVAPREGV